VCLLTCFARGDRGVKIRFATTLPDPILIRDDDNDPERGALLADSVGLVETLSPRERLAFVLHDTFGMPCDEIAFVVGFPPVAARQLAGRARRPFKCSAADMPLLRRLRM
jgi:DNA-directed RNA polymerase specialized sigma24 family protein